jgi:hypothetical protein
MTAMIDATGDDADQGQDRPSLLLTSARVHA